MQETNERYYMRNKRKGYIVLRLLRIYKRIKSVEYFFSNTALEDHDLRHK
jgi:hypothetical protein